MKLLTTLLLAAGFLAGMTASAAAAQGLTENNSAPAAQSPIVTPAPDSGLGGQARAATVTGKKHATTLNGPPPLPPAAAETNHYTRGGATDQHSHMSDHQKTWQAAPFQLEPQGSGPSHKSPTLSKSGLGSRTGHGQTGADVDNTAQQVMSETGKDSNNDLRDQMTAMQKENKKKKALRDFAAQQHKSQAAAKVTLKRGTSNQLTPASGQTDPPPPGSKP